MSLALDLVCGALGPLEKLWRPFCPVQDFQKRKIAILKNPSSEGLSGCGLRISQRFVPRLFEHLAVCGAVGAQQFR